MALVPLDIRQKHNKLLVDLCDLMDIDGPSYKHFVSFLHNAALPAGLLQRVKDEPMKVFHLMEERGILKEGDYSALEKALDASGYKQALDLVRKVGSEITKQIVGLWSSTIGKLAGIDAEIDDPTVEDKRGRLAEGENTVDSPEKRQREHRFPDNSQHIVNIVVEHVANKSKSSNDNVSPEANKEMSTSDEVQTSNDRDKSESGQTNLNEPLSRVNNSGINDTRNHSDFHDFVTKYGAKEHSEKTFCFVTMLDFAGQSVFYTTHQAFMSWRTLYLLVTDMSRSLDDLVKGDTCSRNLNGNMECRIKDYVGYWLNSIYSYGIPTDGSTQHEIEQKKQKLVDGARNLPSVILVATHPEKASVGEDEYFDCVNKMLMDRPQRLLLRGYIAINNFGPDAGIDALKQKIVKLAKKQDYWGEQIPGRWLALEQKLMELRQSGEKIIKYSRVEEINNSMDVKIENLHELELFLKFEHDLGNIVFYNTEKLRNKVVVDPDWLIDGVRILISPSRNVFEDNPEIHLQLFDLKDKGKLTVPVIGCLWSEGEHEDFHQNRDHLLDLMEKLSIIAKPVEKDVGVQNTTQYYWVPCVIDKDAPEHIRNPGPREDMTRTSTLWFVSTTKFIHVGVFHRLVATFLSKWPLAEEDGEYRLYSTCCEFEVDDCHILLLARNDYVILATVFRSTSEGEYPNNELCIDIRKLIFSTLDEIMACITSNSGIDIFVKCNGSSLDISDKTVKCKCSKPVRFVKLGDFTKFWEKKVNCQQRLVEATSPEKQQGDKTYDPPGPISKGHINHVRLHNVLTTVCSCALREVLVTHVPARHGNIYKAILTEKQQLLKILNSDQRQMVFPDPKYRYTGTLKQFDISLLYILIRNVSTVHAPFPNWGITPNDSQRHIGANVERIRLYRNKVGAHSVDGAISETDFEDYWNKIDNVLSDIENVIGDQGYKGELEKRKQQILHPDDLRDKYQECVKHVQAAAYAATDVLKLATEQFQSEVDKLLSLQRI